MWRSCSGAQVVELEDMGPGVAQVTVHIQELCWQQEPVQGLIAAAVD